MASDEVQDPARRFELVSRRVGQSLELALAGELDMAATFKLEPELDRLLDAPDLRRLECDLAGVSFVDSSGLGLLLVLRERAHDRGIAMTVVSVSASVRRILDVSGIGAVLTEAEAWRRADRSRGLVTARDERTRGRVAAPAPPRQEMPGA